MDIKANDKVIIKRGKLAGEAGKVLEVNGEDVALKLDNGTLLLVKSSNLKLPAEVSATLTQVANAISGALTMSEDGINLEQLYESLEAGALPGLREAVERASSEL